MKIKTANFKTFLDKSIMSGKQVLDEGVLDFTEGGLKINCNNKMQQARVMSWLKISSFEKYEIFGKVALNDLSTFVNVIERFGEFITITKEGSILTIVGDNKKVEVEVLAENLLVTDSEPKLEFEDTFTLKAGEIQNIMKDLSTNTSKEEKMLTIVTEDKKVTFKNSGKYKFTNTYESLESKGGITVNFGEPLIDAIQKLRGSLQFSIKNDYPCKVMEVTDNSTITFIVAPRVE